MLAVPYGMGDVYVCGHGGWTTIGRPSGFVPLPAGTEVNFYKEIGHPMYVSEALELLARGGNAISAVRSIGPFKNAPDMTLYPAREFESDFKASAGAGGSTAFVVTAPTSLTRILERFRGNRIHWIACSNRSLRST